MNKKLGILFLAEALHPGGAERQLELLMSSLDRQSFEPLLMTWIDSGQEYDPNSKPYEWVQYVRKRKFDFSPIAYAKRLVRERNIRLVHGILDTGNLYAGILKLVSKNLVFVASERSSKRRLSRFQRFHKPLMHRFADMTVANSQNGLDFVRELGTKEAFSMFIPNGLDTDVFATVTEEKKQQLRPQVFGSTVSVDERILLFVGTIYEAKNQLGLVHAFAKAKLENIRVFLVGKSNEAYLKKVEKAIEEFNVSKQFEILSPQNGIEKLYQAADALILNSAYEGTPNVVLEAMACGLPIIATSVGDVPRYVNHHTGWLVQPNANDDLTTVLQAFSQTSRDRLRSMGLLARDRINELGLSKQQLVERHQSIYLELLAKQQA